VASYRESSLVPGLVGSIGAVTFRTSRSGRVMQTRARPCGQASPAQLQSRAQLQTVASYWRSMTNAQRRAWQNAAINYSVRNRVGELFTLNGFQLFMRVNLHNAHIIIPPNPAVPAVMSALSFTGPVTWGTTPGYRHGYWHPTCDTTSDLTIYYTFGRSFSTVTTATIVQWLPWGSYFYASFPASWQNASGFFEDLWPEPMIQLEIVGVRLQASRIDRLPSPTIECTGVFHITG